MKLPPAVPALPNEKKVVIRPYHEWIDGGIVDGGHRLILGKILEFPQRAIMQSED